MISNLHPSTSMNTLIWSKYVGGNIFGWFLVQLAPKTYPSIKNTAEEWKKLMVKNWSCTCSSVMDFGIQKFFSGKSFIRSRQSPLWNFFPDRMPKSIFWGRKTVILYDFSQKSAFWEGFGTRISRKGCTKKIGSRLIFCTSGVVNKWCSIEVLRHTQLGKKIRKDGAKMVKIMYLGWSR